MKKFILPLASLISSMMIAGPVSAQVDSFSNLNQTQPAVFENSEAQQKIQKIQDLVRAAAGHGIIYSLYFNAAVTAGLQSSAAINDMATVSAKLNSIVNRLASDLSRGRVSPTSIPDQAAIAQKTFTYKLVADNYLDGNMSAYEFIATVIPKNRIYNDAQAIVQNLIDMKASGAWVVKPNNLVVATVSKKTVNNPALVTYTRQRLANFGYSNNMSSKGDLDLDRAIRDFQTDNGLVSDGVAGTTATWKVLDKSIDQLITQAILNLDRTRWLPDQNSAEYIYVNLARQTFQYFENENEALSFRTVNGRLDRQTPMMVDVAREVILNPTWTVPRNIFVKDKIAKFQADPNYASTAHMKMYNDLNGKEVDPTTVDWTKPASTLPYTLVQSPGAWNALGFIKFPLTNRFAIYLHDTNERNLFTENDRLRSSGCVRLQRPFDLGVKLLASPTKWTYEQLVKSTENNPNRETLVDSTLIMASKPTSLGLKRTVPVYLAYKTVQNVYGKLIASNDPYGIDTLMYNVMVSGK